MAATDPTASFDIGMLKPIFRTDFIRSRRVTYREDVRHGEDYFVLLDFFVAGGHALLVPDALYWYVQPFGTLSRQWAHDGGRRYPFEHVKRVNDDVVADMSDRLSPEHLESLIRRGHALEALACLHQLREQLRSANLRQACRLVANAPTGFWRLCARRAGRRVAQSLDSLLWTLGLEKQGYDFVIASAPNVNRLTIGVLASWPSRSGATSPSAPRQPWRSRRRGRQARPA